MRLRPRVACWLCFTCAITVHAQQPFADVNYPAYDEFIQEYEYRDRMPVGDDMRACPGSELAGPQPFPEQITRVRIEYLRGDHFVSQEKRVWSLEPGDGCMLITPKLVREFRMRIGLEEQRAYFAPDKVRRTRDGQSVANSLMAGTAKARQPTPRKVESTPFGVDCGRIDSAVAPGVIANGSMCSVYLPKRCRSELYMAPIEFSADIPGLPMRGRTTRLVIGNEAGVDINRWNIP